MSTLTITTPKFNRKMFAEAFGPNQSAIRFLESLTQDVTVNIPDAITGGVTPVDVFTTAMMISESFVQPPARATSGFAKAQTLATPLTTNAVAATASLILGAGDWDISGTIVFNSVSATVIEQISAGVSLASGALGTPDTYQELQLAVSGGAPFNLAAPVTRVSLPSGGTVYLVALAQFLSSTMTADGYISARPA